ncbi:MAG TPA: cytochrome c oxidase assembly protein [Ktedonobacteraceae bacterium]
MSIWVDANGWPIPPTVLLGCLVAEILYFRGWQVLVKAEQRKTAWARTHPALISFDAGENQRIAWLWRGACFLGAIFATLVASSAPIDNLSSQLLWVHMIQHLLFLVVIAPLLVAAAPLLPLWLGLPRWAHRLVKASAILKAGSAFNRVGHWLRRPAISCVLLITGIWVWHWPALYDLALTNAAIHDWCEHTTFLAVSVLFWTQVMPSHPLRPRLSYPGRMVYVGIAIAQNVVLAVLLGFAPVPLYAHYAHLVTAPGGLSALQDQQFGAGIMWTVGDFPFVGALSILVIRWLAEQPDDTGVALQSHTVTEG